MNKQINIILSQNIDIEKWDGCIRQSNNPVIYAYSYYLNHLADNWSGIVFNDYEAVMPVCWRRKSGIKYSYDVPFVQQLGWFSKNKNLDTALLMENFFSYCKYGDYVFNFNNAVNITKINLCNNYILPLFDSYLSVSENYKPGLHYSLQKAAKQKLVYMHENIDSPIDIYKALYHAKFSHVTEKDFCKFKKLCKFLLQKNAAIARKICNPKNETLAAAVLLKDETRLYNLINCVTEEGRKAEANHFLFDNIFREFAESNLIFDFEGSDVAGIKSFYEKFGATNQPYFRLHFNHLPLPLRLLKR